MTDKKVTHEGQGTFAQLYDVQEQLKREIRIEPGVTGRFHFEPRLHGW